MCRASAYGLRCDVMAEALSRELDGRVRFSKPEGGMFFWARLTGEIDATRLLPYAIEHEVVYVPGKAFYADAARADLHAMRMSFATMNEAQIAEGMVAGPRADACGQRAGVDFAGGLILRKRGARRIVATVYLFPPVTLPAWQAYLNKRPLFVAGALCR